MNEDPADAIASKVSGEGLALLVYGAVVAALVVAIGASNDDDFGTLLVAIVGALIVYWLTHAYVFVVAERVIAPDRGFAGLVRHALRRESPLLLGGLPAAAVFLVCGLVGLEHATAAWVTVWFSVALLASTGYVAARRAGVVGWRLAVEVGSAAAFGLLAVLLKILLH